MHDALIARGKLEKLLEHGRKTVWHPKQDVDWGLSPSKKKDPIEMLTEEQRQALRSLLSLVYYSDSQGRDILQSLCRSFDRREFRSASEFPLAEKVHEFFVQQMDDEHRHATGIRLLFDRLGLEPEERAFSHLFYSKILLSDGLFDAKLILIYWYIEVLAKGIFCELKRRFPQTCIDSLFTKIIRDEARHVGFGEIYIPIHIKQAAKPAYGQMFLAHFSSAAVLPGLYKFGHYSRAARVLELDIQSMFSTGMSEVNAKARRLPAGRKLIDLNDTSRWLSAFI